MAVGAGNEDGTLPRLVERDRHVRGAPQQSEMQIDRLQFIVEERDLGSDPSVDPPAARRRTDEFHRSGILRLITDRHQVFDRLDHVIDMDPKIEIAATSCTGSPSLYRRHAHTLHHQTPDVGAAQVGTRGRGLGHQSEGIARCGEVHAADSPGSPGGGLEQFRVLGQGTRHPVKVDGQEQRRKPIVVPDVGGSGGTPRRQVEAVSEQLGDTRRLLSGELDRQGALGGGSGGHPKSLADAQA
ncbi:unannotated protein [freshwater metagenome]|uniref:Unannotated protein n=1 Tax=freshwater metagenome TaxID=449393 RepID=A0A6J7K4D3_9ZZZZ